MEIIGILRRLDGSVFRDDARSGTGSVEQTAIEPFLNLGDFATVVGADNRVRHAHSMQVAHDGATPENASTVVQ